MTVCEFDEGIPCDREATEDFVVWDPELQRKLRFQFCAHHRRVYLHHSRKPLEVVPY